MILKCICLKNLLNKNSQIITDEENREFNIIRNISIKRKIKKFTIGTRSGNIRILSNKYRENKQIIKIVFNSKAFTITIPLIGYFQVKNLLLAVLAAMRCGIKLEKILEQIYKIKPVQGRLETRS